MCFVFKWQPGFMISGRYTLQGICSIISSLTTACVTALPCKELVKHGVGECERVGVCLTAVFVSNTPRPVVLS